ncbi:MAG: hypothetical protein ACR2IE_06085 [Candidatus Sumerlaeaceae bacterium]
MNRITAEVLCGFFAFAAAIVSGYACWEYLRPEKLRARFSEDSLNYRRWLALSSTLPILLGYSGGFIALLILSGEILPGDRFYPISDAIRIALVPLVAGLAFITVDFILPPGLAPVRNTFTRQRVGSSAWRLPAILVIVLAVALGGAASGIQFPLVSVGREQVVELGQYSVAASIVWLVLATLIVKLLDGLDGAASMLLLLCAGVVYYTTASTLEYFLNAFSVILMGLVIGSLRFHLYPARMPLRGGGTLFIGYLFAVLTVLARQKSVTAGLVVIPLLLFALVLGGAMLGFLERTLTLRKDRSE